MKTVKRAGKLVAVGVAAAGLVGWLAIAAWPARCPVELKLVSIAPSGTFDNDGTEARLVTLNMSNCAAGTLTFAKEGIDIEARVASRWVEAKNLSRVDALGWHHNGEVLLLVPSGTDACRLRIKYLPEPLHLKMMRTFARLGLWRQSGYRALARYVFPVGWFEPLRSDFIGRSPRWRLMSPEVVFPAERGVHAASASDYASAPEFLRTTYFAR